jgi:GNAT superfamily N-acetyltransferase
MKHIDLHDLGRYSDVLLSRSGEVINLRFAEVADAGALQVYFRGLSPHSRYNRLMGAASELPAGQLDRFTHVGEGDGFTLVATTKRDGVEAIIGEARYAIDDESDSLEIGLSVDDTMQGQGIGAALLGNLACRAAALGAGRLFGDTLRSNDAMLALAPGSRFVSRRRLRLRPRIFPVRAGDSWRSPPAVTDSMGFRCAQPIPRSASCP